MKTIEKRDEIHEGDLVELGGELYKAERRSNTLPCIAECEMKGIFGKPYCAGFCFRFTNGMRYVFKHTPVPAGDYTVVEIRRSIKDKIM